MNDRRLHRILRQHLDSDRLLGVEAVPLGVALSEDASAAAAVDSGLPMPAAARDTAEGRLIEEPSPRLIPLPATDGRPLQTLSERRIALQQLDEQQVKGCTRCELSQHRTQTVFGEGDPQARLMVIGEGPGAEEDRTGRPFVGRSGELLDKQLAAIGLVRTDVYIANIVKCRPPDNRAPLPAEAQTCHPYLQQQIAIVRPQVILTLGGQAAKHLLNIKQGITAVRGKWQLYEQADQAIAVMPTFHPAYLLRAYTKENRAKVWEDLQAVMHKLGLSPPDRTR